MTRTRTLTAAAAATLASAVLASVAGSAASAAADARPSAGPAPASSGAAAVQWQWRVTTPLGLPGFGSVAVDDKHQVVYVTGGAGGNSVLVVGFDGQVKQTIDKQYGASGLVLSADGSTLYVALASGDAVSAIDTSTLKQKASYATPVPHTCPTTLARTGSSVWIGYGCGQDWTAGVGVLDTSAASPQIVLQRQDTTGKDVRYLNAPLVSAAIAATGPLAVGEPGLSPATIATYKATGATLSLMHSQPRAGSNLADLALAPDGSAVFAAAGSADRVDAFTPSDLSDTGGYTTGPAPTAIALSPDGTMLAATQAEPYAPLTVFQVGGTASTSAYVLPAGETPAARGVAFSGDGTRLFEVVRTTAPASGTPGRGNGNSDTHGFSLVELQSVPIPPVLGTTSAQTSATAAIPATSNVPDFFSRIPW
jgi:hypothetical protein